MPATTTGEPAVPDEPLEALAHRLGVPVSEVAFLADVDHPTLARLVGAVGDAHLRQERQLAAAFEGTIARIPRPLRGRVRGLLLGG